MDGVAWEAAVHGVAKSRTQLSNFTSQVLGHCVFTVILFLDYFFNFLFDFFIDLLVICSMLSSLHVFFF